MKPRAKPIFTLKRIEDVGVGVVRYNNRAASGVCIREKRERKLEKLS